MSDLIFVYGTLRRACHSNAHYRYLDGASFVGDAKLQATLFRISYYPAVVLTDDDCWVQGEVYQLRDAAQLVRLDEYEECQVPPCNNQEYIRERANVVLASGEHHNVWVYLYNRTTEALEVIDSGDFLNP